MPNFNETITVNFRDKFTRNGNKIAKNAKKIRKELKGVGDEGDKAGRKIKGMGDRASNSLKSMARKFIAFGVAFFGVKKILTTGGEFETAMQGFKAITDIKDIKGFKENALALSKTWGVSATDIAESTTVVASKMSSLIGKKGALEAITEKAVILSKAARMQVTPTLEVLVKSLNQYGKGAENAAQFSEILTRSQTLGAATIQSLGESLKNVGAVGKKFGVNFASTNAALQVLATGGLESAEAGTQLRTTLVRLFTEKKLKKFNPRNFESLADAMGALRVHLDKMSKKRADKFLKDAFGTEAITAASLLLEKTDRLREFEKSFGKVGIKTDMSDTFRAAGANMNTFFEKMKRLSAKVNAKFIRVFDSLMAGGEIDRIIDEIAKAIESITAEDIVKVVDGFKEIAKALIVIAPLIKDIAVGFASGNMTVAEKSKEAFATNLMPDMTKMFQDMFTDQVIELNVTGNVQGANIKAVNKSKNSKLKTANMMGG